MRGVWKGLVFFVKLSLRMEWRYVAYQSLACLLEAALPLLAVYLPKCILEEILGRAELRRLLGLSLGLLGSIAGLRVLVSLCKHKAFEARLRLADRFMQEMYGHMADADYERLESKEYLDLRQKAEKILYGNGYGFGYVLVNALDLLSKGLSLMGFLLLLLRLHPLLLGSFLLLVGLDAGFAARNKRKAIALQLEGAQVEGHTMYMDRLFTEPRFGKELRVYGLKGWFLSRQAEQMEESRGFYTRMNRYWSRSELLAAATELLRQGCTYAYLIAQTLSGAMSVADFTLYAGAATGFAQSLAALLESFIDIKQYGLYYDALEAFLQVPASLRERGDQAPPRQKLDIRFEKVGFRYQGQEAYALKDLSFTLREGESLAVVGENGAGKTTLVKLLLRIYAPTEGRILLGGRDIQTMEYDEYMRLFAAVFQDFELFAFTLLENVALRAQGDRKRAMEVLEQVGLGEYVRSLPGGLDCYMSRLWSKDGVEPSGGQAQRLALARALYKDAPIVVLDEPTAALDPRAEYEIYQGFDRLTQGKTAVYISHRLSSARFCDRVLVLERGRLAQLGSHAELMRQGGPYAELFGMQSRFYV